MGFPDGSLGKRIHLQCRRQRSCRFDPWVWNTPGRRKQQPTPVFMPEKNPMDRGARWSTVQRVAKIRT